MNTIFWVEEATSTNSVISSISDKLDHGTAAAAHTQTAGRGQRGNSWESEPGKNLTFSLLLKPKALPASRQFEISEIVAIAVAKVLRDELRTDDIKIKWPNDIYYLDKKIVGILIENSLTGSRIDRSIAGIGINVNQAEFRSDAPNPVSMLAISGIERPLAPLLVRFVTQIVSDFDSYEADPTPESLSTRYKAMMWRREGYWPYRDNLTGEYIEARITDVAPTGHITLEPRDSAPRSYAFKEVTAILS